MSPPRLASDLLRPDNHALYAEVQRRVSGGETVEHIAKVWFVTPDELLAWILDYKRPRSEKAKPYQSPRFPAIGEPLIKPVDPQQGNAAHRRDAAWQKARTGAAETRRMLEQGK